MSIVLTGATGGLGLLYAQRIAAKRPDAHLILFVRQPDKVPGTLPPRSDKVEYRPLELKNLVSVRQAAEQLADDVKRGRVPPIAALVMSAAIQIVDEKQPFFTDDGYEETMAVCHLSHYLLIRGLLGSLDPNGARVIIVGSATHSATYKHFPRKADWKPLETLLRPEHGCDPPKESDAYGKERYANAKLAQMMTGHELARRLAKRQPHTVVLMYNPGSMGGTGLFRQYSAAQRAVLGAMLHLSSLVNWMDPTVEAARPASSAEQLVHLTSDTEFAKPKSPMGALNTLGGARYFDPWGKEAETEGWALSVDDCEQLWADSARVLGLPVEI